MTKTSAQTFRYTFQNPLAKSKQILYVSKQSLAKLHKEHSTK